MIQKNNKITIYIFTCVGGGQDKPAWTACPPGVKITRVGGKISRDSLHPRGQAVQGGKINCYTSYAISCIHTFIKGVRSFSIWRGGGKPSAANFNTGVGGNTKSTYKHACTCTCMRTHLLNIQTPMHASTRMYACMHSLCKHTFYIMI